MTATYTDAICANCSGRIDHSGICWCDDHAADTRPLCEDGNRAVLDDGLRYAGDDANGNKVYRQSATKRCGDWDGGRMLCSTHEDMAQALYPQGWRYYPGDVCEHGKYVGGCGVDLMCGRCEMGE